MKKKLTLKKEAIVQLTNQTMGLHKGGDPAGTYVTCDMMNTICHSLAKCESIFNPEQCAATQGGGGGARAAGSCGSCGQPTCDGQYSSVPYDCAPTDGGNSCNFPNGCALPSVGCAQ